MTRRTAVASAAPGIWGEGPETRFTSLLFALWSARGFGMLDHPLACRTADRHFPIWPVFLRRSPPWVLPLPSPLGRGQVAHARIAPGSRSAYLAMHVLLKRTWPAGLGCHQSAVCSASRACKAASAASWHSRARVVAPAAHPFDNEGDRGATGGARERRRHYAGDRRSDDGGPAARFAGPHPAKREGAFPHPSMPPPRNEPGADSGSHAAPVVDAEPFGRGAVGPVSGWRSPLR